VPGARQFRFDGARSPAAIGRGHQCLLARTCARRRAAAAAEALESRVHSNQRPAQKRPPTCGRKVTVGATTLDRYAVACAQLQASSNGLVVTLHRCRRHSTTNRWTRTWTAAPHGEIHATPSTVPQPLRAPVVPRHTPAVIARLATALAVASRRLLTVAVEEAAHRVESTDHGARLWTTKGYRYYGARVPFTVVAVGCRWQQTVCAARALAGWPALPSAAAAQVSVGVSAAPPTPRPDTGADAVVVAG
jgi:hypothetical protein